MNAHEIDYHIYGEEMQYVEIELDPQEAVVAEAGSFMMMDNEVKMDTIFGDGSNQDNSVLGKIFSAGKRVLTGESLFMTAFLNMGQRQKESELCIALSGQDIGNRSFREAGQVHLPKRRFFMCGKRGVDWH